MISVLRFLAVLMGLIIISGCSQEKDVSYFQNHPNEILQSALECTSLVAEAVLKNKTCLAIAEIEKPKCEAETREEARIHDGAVFINPKPSPECNNPLYLIARLINQARMKASLAGAPDPLVEYMNKHHAKENKQ